MSPGNGERRLPRRGEDGAETPAKKSVLPSMTHGVVRRYGTELGFRLYQEAMARLTQRGRHE